MERGGGYEGGRGGGRDASVADGRKLFVGGLDWSLEDDDFMNFFKKIGPVESAKVGESVSTCSRRRADPG